MQQTLFTPDPVVYTMEGCRIEHHSSFVTHQLATEWMLALKAELAWTQDTIKLFGKTHLIPRLNAWYGDSGTDFSYSGIPLEAMQWTDTLRVIRTDLEQRCSASLNSVLANWYRTGLDKMGWHSDDESQMCPKSPIVSLSLGAGEKNAVQIKRQNEYGTIESHTRTWRCTRDVSANSRASQALHSHDAQGYKR